MHLPEGTVGLVNCSPGGIEGVTKRCELHYMQEKHDTVGAVVLIKVTSIGTVHTGLRINNHVLISDLPIIKKKSQLVEK